VACQGCLSLDLTQNSLLSGKCKKLQDIGGCGRLTNRAKHYGLAAQLTLTLGILSCVEYLIEEVLWKMIWWKWGFVGFVGSR